MRNRKVGAVPILIIIAASVGIGAFAAIVVTRQINTTLSVVALMDMRVSDWDLVELTDIAFGDLYRGQTERFPASNYYLIENTGEDTLYVSYTKSDWPRDVQCDIYVSLDGGPTMLLAEGAVYQTALDPFGTSSKRIFWYIELTPDTAAAFANYSPTMTWNGHDDPLG